jgi:hypothetical protein
MSERLAVLDLGSNAVRLILAKVTPGVDFRVLRQERVQTRLAGHRRGLLPRSGVEQMLAASARVCRGCPTAFARLDRRSIFRARPRALFRHHDAPECFLASADWMPRNLDRRVEIAFPVLAPGLRGQLAAILDVQLGDTVKARLIRPDGTSQRISASPRLRSQERLWELTHPLQS